MISPSDSQLTQIDWEAPLYSLLMICARITSDSEITDVVRSTTIRRNSFGYLPTRLFATRRFLSLQSVPFPSVSV
jgi:hypothetical protein